MQGAPAEVNQQPTGVAAFRQRVQLAMPLQPPTGSGNYGLDVEGTAPIVRLPACLESSMLAYILYM